MSQHVKTPQHVEEQDSHAANRLVLHDNIKNASAASNVEPVPVQMA
jgi:hypothetical protein